jgi:diguanylate cyclase (GGDEF)-like protein
MNATQLLSRDELEATLAAVSEAVPLALALTDLDEFGEINRDLGREAGDSVLRAFERTLTRSVPAEAVVARISGDEYAVALPGAGAESALILLEEIRAHFSSRPPSELVPEPVAVSVGVAARPQHATGVAEVMRAAGEALYRAKKEGGGRVAIYVEDKMTLKSSYYSRAALDRLAKLSAATSRTEASLLREGLDDLLAKYAGEL